MANLSGIMQLYTAYFNRAADKAGVDYWLGMMDSNGWELDNVAQSFSDSVEYQNQYNGLNQIQIVEKVYQNVLNRAGEAAGVDYWAKELSSGNILVSQLVQAVVNSATEMVDGAYVQATDAAIVNNKTAVSQYCYDNNVNATGNEAIYLSTITTDSSSVSSIQSIASAFIDSSNSNTQSAIYHKSWSIQDTDYYEIGDNLLFEVNYDTNDGNPNYYLSNYTITGNTYNLTGLDGDKINLTIDNLSAGSNITIVGITENFTETTTITNVGEIELNGTRYAELFDITGLNAQEYVASDNSHYMSNGYNLKLYSNNYNLYDLNNDNIVGVGTVKNDAIYLVYEDDGALEVVIYDNKTDIASGYYLGEIA